MTTSLILCLSCNKWSCGTYENCWIEWNALIRQKCYRESTYCQSTDTERHMWDSINCAISAEWRTKKQTLKFAGIGGIQISVFASRSKSWDFYKCGHKNLTNYRDQHCGANRKKSCDYLGINAIICIAADVWMLEQIIMVFPIPSFQASVSKQGQGLYSCLIWGMRSSVNRIIPLGDKQDISACLDKRKQISVFQSRWKSQSFLCMNAPIVGRSGVVGSDRGWGKGKREREWNHGWVSQVNII